MVRCIIDIKPENKKNYAKFLYDGLNGQSGEVIKYFEEFGDKMVRIKPDKIVPDYWGFSSELWSIHAEDIRPTTLL